MTNTDTALRPPRTEAERVAQQEPKIINVPPPTAFPGHEFSSEVVETIVAPGFEDPIVDPETGEVSVLVRNKKDEELAGSERIDPSLSEYPKRVTLHKSHTIIRRHVPLAGFMRDSATGHLKGIEQAPHAAVIAGEWPKWVPVHDSYIVERGEAKEKVVQGFAEWHRDRATGKCSVLVNNEDEEKRASAALSADAAKS